MADQPGNKFNIDRFKRILLGYAMLLAVTGIYVNFISNHKPPHLTIINFSFTILNLSIIGLLLYQWDKVRRWNMEVEQAT